jgi:peptidoglycan/LPS O-acetylase OafA/YrhL
MNKPPMLHSLNAARVVAEFVVVHHHISFLFADANGLLSRATMPDSLMSFFFVLSGFVAMHCNIDVDFSDRSNAWRYIVKRFQKTYPTYILMFFADLPGTIVTRQNPECALFWISVASQPFLLHSWLGSQHISISNGVGWYLCTVYWLWMAFPFLRVRYILSEHAWIKICLLYCLSLMLWLLLAPYNIVYTRAVPVFRVFEFLMGCGVAFTLDSKLPGQLVLAGLAAFFAYCAFDFQSPGLWENEQLYGNCTLWIKRHNQGMTPTIILSKFAIVWAVLIHWLACTELHSQAENAAVQILQFDVFKHLSAFSLQLYLCHYTVARFIETISKAIGIFGWWDFDTMIVACYAVAYAISVWTQPIIDKVAFLAKCRGTEVSHALPTVQQSPTLGGLHTQRAGADAGV